MQLVNSRLAGGDETSAQELLTELIDRARVSPGFLKPQMDNVANAMATVACSAALDTSTRKLATEFIVSYAESAPGVADVVRAGVGALCTAVGVVVQA